MRAHEAEFLERMALPFLDARPSILTLVRAAAANRTDSNAPLDIQLPEEEGEEDPERSIRFVAGGLDALFGGRDQSAKQTKSRTLVVAITKVLRHPSPEAFAAAYALLKRGRTNAIVDETLERIAPELPERRKALAAFSRRLVTEAKDVEPVKMGVALLGISGAASDEALLIEMGQSDEFTPYCMVALANLLPDSEESTWRLAQNAHGWGRIAAVERLSNTQEPRIKAWLLREGFRNDVMNEYLAYIAATTGGMLEALSAPSIDEPLLSATAEILLALIAGGPAEQIEDYREAAAACAAFLRHALQRDTPALTVVSAVSQVRQLAEGERADRLRALPGWSSQTFLDIRTHASLFMQRPGARAAVEIGLRSEEPGWEHFVAGQLAPAFGIDPWPFHLDRQRRRIGTNWWHLMQTEDASRVKQVLALAREQLDLSRVGSGPTQSLGLGAEYEDDSAADFIMQDLRRFPGQGADFIEMGLRGRSIRLRNMTINALRDWGRHRWPVGAEELVKGALLREPEQDVRKRLKLLLAGRLAD